MEREGSGGSGGSAGLLQQILSLKVVPRVGNGTLCPNSTSLCSFPEMWYGVFLWALVSSLFFHVPAGLLALFTLRHHKYDRSPYVSKAGVQWSQSWLTAASTSWTQIILLYQPPKKLGLQGCATIPCLANFFVFF
ncbi:transmembrane protein 170A isoform X2 [Macaca thibetana thibetana]|uniref:transmembrane protein 170A isoform X2 n=1 Tax=Macaca thibetana thibetana TaxID=257877 RepID=UPI0021BC7F35|nr:transmembrane protein 170A isoform X2 [Macaca thibetana thibetana]